MRQVTALKLTLSRLTYCDLLGLIQTYRLTIEVSKPSASATTNAAQR